MPVELETQNISSGLANLNQRDILFFLNFLKKSVQNLRINLC